MGGCTQSLQFHSKSLQHEMSSSGFWALQLFGHTLAIPLLCLKLVHLNGPATLPWTPWSGPLGPRADEENTCAILRGAGCTFQVAPLNLRSGTDLIS